MKRKIKFNKILAGNLGQGGFTLLEILLVLALLTIVFSMFGGSLMGNFAKGKYQATKIQIKQLEGALDGYQMDCNDYPKGNPGPGLKALVSGEGIDCKNYNPSGYLNGKKNVPTDAWGAEFIYTSADGRTYELKSFGADKKEGGDGWNKDIISGEE